MARNERLLTLLLRMGGTVSLLALLAVVMPRSWMAACHQRLGLGTLPAEPIVGYLARSTSMLYALYGGLLWVVSLNVRRLRPVAVYAGVATVFLGIVITIVDLVEKLPLWWTIAECAFTVVFGTLILWLAAKVRRY